METRWLPSKEKVPVAEQSVKKVMLTVFYNMKGPSIIDFLEKDATQDCAF